MSREELEAKHGQVWDTNEMTDDFTVMGFSAPYVVVRKRDTYVVGSLQFQHSPRFYFNFVEDHA